MQKYTMTCNCYEPPVREDVVVTSSSIFSAWDTAKNRFRKRHDVKPEDVAITSVRSSEV